MSIMFVRVQTPECAVQITVEQLARAMATEAYFKSDSECSKIMVTLTKLASGGFISDSYYSDFVETATRMSKYVRINVAKEIYPDTTSDKPRRSMLGY